MAREREEGNGEGGREKKRNGKEWKKKESDRQPGREKDRKKNSALFKKHPDFLVLSNPDRVVFVFVSSLFFCPVFYTLSFETPARVKEKLFLSLSLRKAAGGEAATIQNHRPLRF
jgi:hypothetical protein